MYWAHEFKNNIWMLKEHYEGKEPRRSQVDKDI